MKIIEIVLAVFAVLGVIDLIIGNKFKIGKEFEKGIMAMGSVVFGVVGMIVLSPTLAKILLPVFKPVSEILHIDASVLSGFFACDAGGGIMAFELSSSELWCGYNGIVVGSMLGCTISLIPMSLKMTDKKYHEDVLTGLLCGIATIPIGCIIGGLIIGCSFFQLMLNSLPAIIISIITCIGLILNQTLCRKIFKIIGQLLLTVLYIGLGTGVFEKLTGIALVPYAAPIDEAFDTVCYIAILLAGIFPFLAIISKLFNKMFTALGKLIGIDETSVVGLITSLASCIPMYVLVDKMNKKGRIMNYAFIASASFVFGDHLAFTMALSKDINLDSKYLIGMVVGKLVGGIASLIVAHFLYEHTKESKTVEA